MEQLRNFYKFYKCNRIRKTKHRGKDDTYPQAHAGLVWGTDGSLVRHFIISTTFLSQFCQFCPGRKMLWTFLYIRPIDIFTPIPCSRLTVAQKFVCFVNQNFNNLLCPGDQKLQTVSLGTTLPEAQGS